MAPLLGGEDGALAVLTKTADDEVVGRIDASSVAFMPLRREVDNPLAPDHGIADAGTEMTHYGTTALDPAILWNAPPDLLLFVHLHISGASFGTAEGPGGLAVTVSSPDGHASAFVESENDGTWTVQQRGRRLWGMLDRPARTRLGITALDRVDRQFVWLDEPDGPYSWPLSL